MARTGLRMMPTFPSPALKFRTAGFPRYGFQAGISDTAFPNCWFAIVLRVRCCPPWFPALCQARCAVEHLRSKSVAQIEDFRLMILDCGNLKSAITNRKSKSILAEPGPSARHSIEVA